MSVFDQMARGFQLGYNTVDQGMARREQREARGALAQIGQQYAGGDRQGAINSAMSQGRFDVAATLAKMPDDQKQAVAQRNQLVGQVGLALRQMSYEQRKQALQTGTYQDALLNAGLSKDQVANYDPTDANINLALSQVDELEGALKRDYDNRKQGEVERSNRASERIGRQNADTSRMNALKPSSPMVSINQGNVESEFSKGLGKIQAKQVERYVDEADNARGQISTLSRMQQLMNEPGFKSGAIAPAGLAVGKLFADFGIEVDGVPSQEAFNALSNQLALQIRNPDSGMGLPGATSDRDLRFLKDSVPTISKSEEGNAKILEIATRMQRRKMEVAELVTQYAYEKGSLLGFETFLQQWAEQNPMFGDLEHGTGVSGTESPPTRRRRYNPETGGLE